MTNNPLYRLQELNEILITEEKVEKHLKVSLLDVDKFVKANEIQEITNPLFFIRDNYPNPDGLLSNEIFGITKEQRANIYGYISLKETFMHPLCYKIWSRMDSTIKHISHGTNKYIITDSGHFKEDPNGKTGLKFLKANINKIKIHSTGSTRRDTNIEFLMNNKDKMFMDKYIVIPPYYRDVKTTKNGPINIGSINRLYASLITSVKALQETADYGFSMDDACKGRIQDTLVSIYDWFCGNNNPSIEKDTVGLSKKLGLIKTSVLSKTTDYASRLIISAPSVSAERVEDLMVTIDYSAVPLASVASTFYPFMIHTIKGYIDDWFSGMNRIEFVDKKGNSSFVRAHEPDLQFSDERIKEELKRFIHGFSNRFIPIEIVVDDMEGNKLRDKHYLRFKGWDNKPDSLNKSSILVDRRMTWLDIFYMAACEVSQNKTILITRYPIDSCFNQFPTKIRVSSTKDTESIYYGDTYYKWYPKIREKDIGVDTSDLFIDTLQMSNLYLDAIDGDYDGDQVSVKGVYTVESNDELLKFISSKRNYIGLGGKINKKSLKEATQSIYNLTKVLNETKPKLKEVVF